LELNSLSRLNERYIHYRIQEAQAQAKEQGVNLFVIRPDDIPPGLGLLEIDANVIDLVKHREARRMKDYLADLDKHNLRFAPPIQSPLFCTPFPDRRDYERPGTASQ
jgi:hypothetical protein